MLVLLLAHFLLTVSDGAVCGGSNETTYLRSEGLRLMEFATHSLSKVTLNRCADACSKDEKGHLCSSFEYDAQSQECAMHAEDGQPLGPSVLAKADGPLAFFQQICVNENRLCPTPYAFERHPQSLLIGHALHVSVVNGLSECLSLCLSSFSTLSVPCNSAMYFYETGECILNRAIRADFPHLFKKGVQDLLVDYFENVCQDVDCGGGVLHWIRSEDFRIAPRKDVIIESSSIEECRALCSANLIGEERFPCRAFVFSGSRSECHLSAEAGLPSKAKSPQSAQLSPISSGEYFQKYCLNTTVRCVDASFEHVVNRKVNAESYRTVATPSVHACLSFCIDDGASCASVTYDSVDDLCKLSDKSQFSHPELFVPSEGSDYFDKICDTAALDSQATTHAAPRLNAVSPLPTSEEPPSGATEAEDEDPPPTEVSATALGHMEAEAEEEVIDDDKNFVEEKTVEKNPVKAHLTTECRMSGVTVVVAFSQNTSGSIYIKDHFATCRTVFDEAKDVELHIPFPKSDEASPRCPGLEMSPSHWSFTVVVQRNEMSSPSLVTSTDRIFNVTCDYTKLVEKNIFPSPIEGEIKSSKIKMSILREGAPVTVVPLGEKVELRWTIIDAAVGLGFLVNECVAERVGGSAPEPEPLKLIYRGCPEERVAGRLMDSPVEQIPGGFSTRLKVFRFDGSRRVRIKCSIDVCVDECPPVVCDGNQRSYGRKRRSARVKPDFSFQSRKNFYQSRSNLVVGTLTVVERQPHKKTKRPRPEFLASDERLCVLRWQATAVAVAAVLLGSAGLLAIARGLHNMCSPPADDESCSSSVSGVTSSSVYSSSMNTRIYDEPRRHR